MSPYHSNRHKNSSGHKSMPLLENVYAVSRNDDSFEHIGLYDGRTGDAIPGGRYYQYLGQTPEELRHATGEFNYYYTGHGLRQADKDRAMPGDFSAFGTGTPIFGGYIDSHMGHFFVEVLSRGIDFSSYNEHPFVFLLFKKRNDLKVFFKYCEFFGLNEKQIVIIDKPCIIPELYVPHPQFFITHEYIKKTGESTYAYQNTNLSSKHLSAEYLSEDFLEVHRTKGDSITLEENTVDKILYLSCVKSKNYFGEELIHKALEEHGHTVIYPEEHSWESVISLVRKHTHIAGLRGSAMHFLMFCRKSKKVTYFDRFPMLHPNFHNLEQMMCNKVDFVYFRIDETPNGPHPDNLFRYEDIVLLLKKLGINRLSSDYPALYRQVTVPEHMEYWRNKPGNESR